MNRFEHSPAQTTGPRADEAWAPPQLRRVMRDMDTLPLGERVRQAIVWCAEAAVRARRTGAAASPAGAFRDAAWDVLLHLLFEDARGRIATVAGLDAVDGLAPGEGAQWVEALEDVGLAAQFAIPGARSAHVMITAPARLVMLELLLDPASWDGPVLCRAITLWQLAERARLRALHD